MSTITIMDKHKVLEQLLEKLQCFLKVLDGENLSGNATVQKSLLTDLLQTYKSSDGGDEEYIYMNKVIVTGKNQDKTDKDARADAETNENVGKHVSAPQKSLPELPTPRTPMIGREPFPLSPAPIPACVDSPESYYEEAQPYDPTINDDGEAVSSSYESYDEEEVTKGKSSAQHQWPSTEASIELMKDARICAFLWRKKWLGQWAKQLCVIRDNHLLCYKSSKDQTPLLDVSLVGCTVTYKEKQPKKKEHKLKINPQGGEAIVLGLQSKKQAEQWLKVIQEISPKSAESSDITDSPRLICTKTELTERNSLESSSSTDSHTENLENKDVKKKYGSGLKLSNLMNIGKKMISSLEGSEKCVETSGYLNVFVNSQWRTRWCLIQKGQLLFYHDKGKSKVAQQPVSLEGCMVLPDPSPEHLYSFRIQMDGEELAILEAKSSADMGHWLGLLLSQTGTKTDPAELTYDYVNSERISSIVNAAKTSMYLMQRRYSEPNMYTESLPTNNHGSDDIYDVVASTENEQEEACDIYCGLVPNVEPDEKDREYLDLITVRSFLHTNAGQTSPRTPQRVPSPIPTPNNVQHNSGKKDAIPEYETVLPATTERFVPPAVPPRLDVDASPPSPPIQSQPQTQPHQAQAQEVISPGHRGQNRSSTLSSLSMLNTPHSPPATRGRAASAERYHDRYKPFMAGCPGSIEVKLGKNRTEADVRRFTDEKERLEREKDEVKTTLATLRKERRELKEELSSCQDPSKQASLEVHLKQKEEACREAEHRRVEVELRLVKVKENLRKSEAGPFTLGTTVDSSLLDYPLPKTSTPALLTAAPITSCETAPVNSATTLKNRPLSVMAPSKGNVLQKAKEWEKKSTT
ncbi:actin filament-associated protein 1-like 2 isoform X2 [Trichomycterus rosablanca]|uniref:actin filament-associated protein 1-like 2 isoform X2 n=1 Tax=Trichomycterus rosablanca TaxID=2290929 RepID=UPI002F3563FD